MNAARIVIGAAFVLSGRMATAQTSAPAASTSQQISVAAGSRSYVIGDTTLTEQVGAVFYDARAGRFRARLDGTLIRYDAPPGSIHGRTPISLRLDFAPRLRDTLTIYGRSASTPGALDSVQTEAIGAAATSTVDLESFWLGTPAMGGVRAAVDVPLGRSSGAHLSVRGAVEVEPEPSGSEPIYWRGTSVLGGATISGVAGDLELGLRADVRYSYADSLGGRNLFPGGGLILTRATARRTFLNPLDVLADDGAVTFAAFYSRNVGTSRNNQPNRLIQTGGLLGASANLTLPYRAVWLLPTVEALRESSTSHGTTELDENTGRAWTTRVGLAALVPLSRVIDITPELGYATGRLSASYLRAVTGARGATVYQPVDVSSPMHGWWARMELTLSY